MINGKEGEDFYKVQHVPSIKLIDGKSLICAFSFLLLHLQTHQKKKKRKKEKKGKHSIFNHQPFDYIFLFY